MNEFLVLLLICVLACIFSVLIKQYLKEQALLLILAVICISIIKLVELFLPISDLLNNIFEDTNIDMEYYKILLKSFLQKQVKTLRLILFMTLKKQAL